MNEAYLDYNGLLRYDELLKLELVSGNTRDNTKVAKAGDTMTGDLRLSSNNLYFGSASGSLCHLLYDNTNKCLKFLFD